jgi:hypothetical protein
VHPPTNNKLTYRYFGDHIAGSVPSTVHSVKFIWFLCFSLLHRNASYIPSFFSSVWLYATDEKVTVLESEKRAWESSPEAQAMREALNPWRKHDEQQKK